MAQNYIHVTDLQYSVRLYKMLVKGPDTDHDVEMSKTNQGHKLN